MSHRVRLLERRARLRWAHLLLGGALLMPYQLVGMALIPLLAPGADPFQSLSWQLVAFAASLPVVAATGWLFPLVRTLETYAAQALCGVRSDALAGGGAASGEARRRTAGWFTLHVGLGALVSAVSLAMPPLAVVMLLVPFVPTVRETDWGGSWDWVGGPLFWLAPFAGVALLAALATAAYGAGVLLARCAPPLLGPTPADRLAAAEERARVLASRNRLARELHDSVGHALSAVTLQAGAARRVLDADREFAREALAAIEETARDAVAELDTVLGILREPSDEGADDDDGGPDDAGGDGGAGARRKGRPGPTLAAGLAGLLARTRASGARIEWTAGEDVVLDSLPAAISREAYRIIQEGLSNALRHGGQAPVTARLALVRGGADGHSGADGTDRTDGAGRTGDGGGVLEIVMENPLPRQADGPVRAAAGRERTGGGRGLAGIEERATLLGGSAQAGEARSRDGAPLWRLTARLPLPEAGRDTRPGRGDRRPR